MPKQLAWAFVVCASPFGQRTGSALAFLARAVFPHRPMQRPTCAFSNPEYISFNGEHGTKKKFRYRSNTRSFARNAWSKGQQSPIDHGSSTYLDLIDDPPSAKKVIGDALSEAHQELKELNNAAAASTGVVSETTSNSINLGAATYLDLADALSDSLIAEYCLGDLDFTSDLCAVDASQKNVRDTEAKPSVSFEADTDMYMPFADSLSDSLGSDFLCFLDEDEDFIDDVVAIPTRTHPLLQQRDSLGPHPVESTERLTKITRPKPHPPRVNKHLWRYYSDISVACWLATVTPTEFFLSCNYTVPELNELARKYPWLLDTEDIRNDLAPKMRFLVRTLGAGRGDICDGSIAHMHSPVSDDGGDDNDDFCPHDLSMSEEGKASVPAEFFRHRLERAVAPRHAYLTYHADDLPHGRELLKNKGRLFKEFLACCDRPASAFASLCNRWSHDLGHHLAAVPLLVHTPERIEAFEGAFRRGLFSAAKNEPSKDLDAIGCTPGRMTEILMKHGANPLEHDRSGASVLHWAAGTGNLDGLKAVLPEPEDGRCLGDVLLESMDSKDGATPLHWASCGIDGGFFGSGGHVTICRYLLEAAGNKRVELVNAETMTGSTALMWVALSGSLDVAKLLVSFGADVHRKNHIGCNVAHWAAASGKLTMCKYLHEIGVDFLEETTLGLTALDYAISHGRYDVADWIKATFPAADQDRSQHLGDANIVPPGLVEHAEESASSILVYPSLPFVHPVGYF